MDAKEALEKAEDAKTYWSDIYEAFRDDVRFSIGLDHWSDEDIRRRGEDGCMVVPVLPQFIHQVTNDMRQNTPSINVIPGDGEGADHETAKIFKGLIRNIEYKSRADEIYDTAGEYAVRGGFGFARVDHDYVDEESFLQELILRRVQNPESVYIDPNSVECDGSDAEWGFALEEISKEDFEDKYPGKAFKSFDTKMRDSDADTITICEFFVKKYTVISKQLTEVGDIVDNVPDEDEEKEKKKNKRKLRKVTIERYRFSGEDTLENTTFPGKYIPIVPFYGEEVWVDGERHLLSLIRLAKDAQRRVNKWATKESELLDMAPIAPVMAPVGAVDDFMDEWGRPGEVNVMRYRTHNAAGEPIPVPTRLNPPTVPTGFINAMEGAKESVKEALGMYNASIGQKSNAISGVAYDAQKTEADVATFHFQDNRNRSIQHIGRILVYAIPEIYDTARIIQIIGPEEEPQTIGINGSPMQDGQEQAHDLRKGKYEVRVTTGASYTTKRQEAAALFGDVIKNNPQLMQVIGDLWAKNLDVAGADAMAERLKKMVPPALVADEDKGNPVDPEKIQMGQIIQQLQAQVQQLGAAAESNQGEQQAKVMEQQNKSGELQLKAGELQLKQQVEQSKSEIERMKLQLDAEKLELERQKLEIDAMNAAKEPMPATAPSQSTGIKLDTTGFQFSKTPEAEAAEAQTAQEEAMRQTAEQEQCRIDNELKAAQTQAVIQSLNAITNQLGALSAQVAQPKQVVRDRDTGAIVGVT